MPIPLIALDLPSMGEPQAIAPPAVVSTEWVDQAIPSPWGLASGVETPQPASLTVEAIQPGEGPPGRIQAGDGSTQAPPPSLAEGALADGEAGRPVEADDDRPEEATTAPTLADPDPAEPVGDWSAADRPLTPDPTATEAREETGHDPAVPDHGREIADDLALPEDGTWIRIVADRQAMDVQRQVVTATGDVQVQFGRDNIAAEQIWINLNNRYLRAEGGVLLNRNQQVLEGETATYNLLQGAGSLTQARGVLQAATLAEDFSTTFPNDLTTDALDPFSDRLQGPGSISQVTSPGGVSFSLNGAAAIFGAERSGLGRLRFEAEQLSFDASGWYGDHLRLTNDPFSPPELELRGNRVSFIPTSESEDELCIENPRLVFDQRLSLPLLRPCYQFQNGELPANFLNPLMVNIGYDSRDRDGLFIDREFPAFEAGRFQVTIAPQVYLSRWLGESSDGLFDPANVGLVARARGSLGPRTTTSITASLPGLDLGNFADRLRAKLLVQRLVGTHRLGVEYTYRDRLFNGTLGFQDVQSSAGLLLESPVIPLGASGLNLSYQVSGQYVTATTDRPDLLEPGRTEGLTSLVRTQGAVDLSHSVLLWQGEPQPSTATEGLRFSPQPIVPSLALATGLRGVGTYYSSSNFQESLDARVQLSGQVGHLSRNYFDYTQFNIGLFRGFIGGNDSPFLFDRQVDRSVISGGLVQQIYGPVLLGVQTAFNLNTGQEVDTSFSLEYRRRAYGFVAHYSPTRETGFLGFRLSQFDWVGQTEPFDSNNPPPTLDLQ